FRRGNVPFHVMCVLYKTGLGGTGHSQDDIVLIPLSTAKSRVLGAVRGTSRQAMDLIFVKLADASAMAGAKNEIELLLRQRHRIRRGCTPRFPNPKPTANPTAPGAR